MAKYRVTQHESGYWHVERRFLFGLLWLPVTCFLTERAATVHAQSLEASS